MSRQSCAVPSCPWGYRFGFQPFSCASVDFQCVLGGFLCIFFFLPSQKRKARLLCSRGLQAVKCWSKPNGCSLSGVWERSPLHAGIRQSALDSKASDVAWITCVCSGAWQLSVWMWWPRVLWSLLGVWEPCTVQAAWGICLCKFWHVSAFLLVPSWGSNHLHDAPSTNSPF